MKKTYRFSIDFEVEINDGLIYDQNGEYERIKSFLKAFIEDDQALLNYFKLYFLDTFSFSEYHKELSEHINLPEEKVTMRAVSSRTPEEVRRYINGLFDPKASDSMKISDNIRVAARDLFYSQFGELAILKADFSEVNSESNDSTDEQRLKGGQDERSKSQNFRNG